MSSRFNRNFTFWLFLAFLFLFIAFLVFLGVTALFNTASIFWQKLLVSGFALAAFVAFIHFLLFVPFSVEIADSKIKINSFMPQVIDAKDVAQIKVTGAYMSPNTSLVFYMSNESKHSFAFCNNFANVEGLRKEIEKATGKKIKA